MNMNVGLGLPEIKEIVKQKLIIDRLELEDIVAADIEDSMTLFGDGLGLDSVEAFEVMVGMEEIFGVMVEGIPADELRSHLQNVNTIAAFIQSRIPAQS